MGHAGGGEGEFFSRSRLEAFSDGVIAVIITIMVLDLKAPESDRPEDLLKLWPAFLSYFISFVFVAIYWINHHGSIILVRHVTPAILWANNLLLLCLSLFPFATAYMAATHVGTTATTLYAILQFACAWSFGLLGWLIDRQHRDDVVFMARIRAGIVKGRIAQTLYFLAIPAAMYVPAVSIAIFITIAILYTSPRLLISKTLATAG
jgi:uncharacterized membrane protein